MQLIACLDDGLLRYGILLLKFMHVCDLYSSSGPVNNGSGTGNESGKMHSVDDINDNNSRFFSSFISSML